MKRSRKAKSPLSLELVREIDQLLQRFTRSENFEMLSKLPITHFLNVPAGKFAKLSEYTLGRVVEIGAAKTCGLPGLTASDAQDLKIAIERLCGSESGMTATEPPSAPADSFDSKDVTFFASSEAEIRLSQALQRLKSSDGFESIKKRTLGEFWTESAPRSPFEECITFNQLAEMNLESFLRKKSFTAARIDAMMSAIQNCLASIEDEQVVSLPSRGNAEKAAPVVDRALEEWIAGPESMPSHLACGVLHLVVELRRAACSSKALWPVLADLPGYLTARELGLLWLEAEHAPGIVVDVLREDPEKIRAFDMAAKEKLSSALVRRCPEVIAHVRSALSSPGISFDELFSPHRSGILPAPLEDAVFRIVLSTLDAAPVTALGTTIENHITTAPGALELIIAGLLSGLPKHDTRLREEIRVLVPFIDPQLVLELMARRAKLNHTKSIWEPRADSGRATDE